MSQIRSLILMSPAKVREQLVTILVNQKHKILVRETPNSIANHVAKFKPNAVFIDLDNSTLGGLEVMKFIRRQAGTQDILFFVFSKRTDDSTIIQTLSSGASEFVRIPFISAEFCLRLRALLKSASLKAQLEYQRKSLACFFSPRIVDAITTGVIKPELAGRTLNAVILYAKLWHAHKVAELKTPLELAKTISHIYSAVNLAAESFGGTVISSRGDAFVLGFGVPVEVENKYDAGIQAAVSLLQLSNHALSRDSVLERNKIRLGVAVSSGQVYAGTIGSQIKMEYTVLGGPVTQAENLYEFGVHRHIQLVIDSSLEKKAGVPLTRLGPRFGGNPVFTAGQMPQPANDKVAHLSLQAHKPAV